MRETILRCPAVRKLNRANGQPRVREANPQGASKISDDATIRVINLIASRSATPKLGGMKFLLLQILAVTASVALYAQSSSNSPASGDAKPESPLSQATLNKIQKMSPLFDGKTLDGKRPLRASSIYIFYLHIPEG